MPISQFINTLNLIYKSDRQSKLQSIIKHLFWQLRKFFNLFPYQQKISKSLIIAEDKYNGVSALINCMVMYDYNNMHLIKILLENGGTFFDVGANIGSYTLIASEQPKANIYSFEPHPKTFSSLMNNVRLNNRSNVKVFNLAVSERDEPVFFSNLIQSPINHILNNYDDNSISVNSIRMDTFICKNKIVPEFVKIDVEGYEYSALLSFGKYLDSIKIFFIEYNQQAERNLINNLLERNYIGPLNFNYEHRMFSRKLKDINEDSIFIEKNYKETLLKMNLNFQI